VSAGYGVVIVRWNFLEAQLLIQGTGGFHIVQGVEQDVVVAADTGRIQDGFGQLATQTQATEGRAHIQTLHFAGIGIVGRIQRTQGAATGQRPVHGGQQEGTAWRGIVPGQGGQFLLEALETEVDAQTVGILAKYLAHGLQVGGVLRRQDLDGGAVHGGGKSLKRGKFSVMKKQYSLLGLLLVGLLAGCQSVQTTGAGQVGVTRNQYMGVSAAQVDAASAQSYSKMLKEAEAKKQLDRDPVMVARVQGIAKKLIAQTVHFRPDAPQWNWETHVFQSAEVNAFCMAGGKIGIYSGLIEKLKITDDELAAVMGHEIAHALREHVREQVSLQQAARLPGLVLAVVTGNQVLADLGDTVTGVSLTLPRSREAEREADQIGVELAARAGYDPRAAISLWQKMNQLGGSRPPQFLSTHPAPESRQQDLTRISDVVMPLYEASRPR
jgi:Zn-dependent protease with chaperone function